MYINNTNDQPTSTFGAVYETMFVIIRKSTQTPAYCVLNMGNFHSYRRNRQNAI